MALETSSRIGFGVMTPDSSARLRSPVGRHPLLAYVVIAFGFSWLYEVAIVLAMHPRGFTTAPAPLTLGPFLAAFLVTAATEGRPGIARLARRLVAWRVSVGWYALVILSPALIVVGVNLISGAAVTPPSLSASLPLMVIGIFAMILVGGGALGEEPGWRGFALPRLQQQFGPLPSTLLLGVLWALWHLPLFVLIPGYDGVQSGLAGFAAPFGSFVLTIAAYAVICTWVYNATRSSLLLVILLHAAIDTSVTLGHPDPWLKTVVWVAVALLVIGATAGRLNCPREDPRSVAWREDVG